MKVGTDAVLLGSWASIEDQKRILDVGTGCGILSLIAAQRSNALIDAIDIDEPSVSEASENFTHSPWAERLSAVACSLSQWETTEKYTYIISNPPYFQHQLPSLDPRRSAARHSLKLSPDELAFHAKRLLRSEGKVGLVCTSEHFHPFDKALTAVGFCLHRRKKVSPFDHKPAALILLEYGLELFEGVEESPIVLYDESANRTRDYRLLTQDLYL